MTRPPIQPSEWWALVDPQGKIVDVGEDKRHYDTCVCPGDGWSIRRVIVTEAPEVER